jgi:hypothetical protein
MPGAVYDWRRQNDRICEILPLKRIQTTLPNNQLLDHQADCCFDHQADCCFDHQADCCFDHQANNCFDHQANNCFDHQADCCFDHQADCCFEAAIFEIVEFYRLANLNILYMIKQFLIFFGKYQIVSKIQTL